MPPALRKKFDFAQAFKELEEITAWFERESVDLEEGIRKFERGLELASLLKERLKVVENKVKEVKVKFSDFFDESGTGKEADLDKVEEPQELNFSAGSGSALGG